MSRNKTFRPDREPLRQHASLQLDLNRTTGPVKFLNPTRAHFRYVEIKDSHSSSDGQHPERPLSKDTQTADKIEYRWTSRNNRKGRHQLRVAPVQDPTSATYMTPRSTASIGEISKGVLRMFIQYPYWDISWLVAYVFTWGSIVWVINAFFVYLPLERPGTEFHNEILYGGGITAFIGATIFEVGSVFLMLEAVNENRAGCFGWAVRQVLEDHHGEKGGYLRLEPHYGSCTHHHSNKKNLVGKSVRPTSSDDNDGKTWTWWPSWSDLRTHYLHELGFLACLFQLIGATIFWIAGFTALPGIFDRLSPSLEDGVYWTPQVVGGSGFIISGTLFMLETQSRWYIPALRVLGWHIGFWNLVGGIGFTLSPAFGYDTRSWAQYQAALSTFWGSWAFLFGSLIQLYESVEKHPVDVSKVEKNDAWK